jgi:hypothetical protein
MHLVTEMLDLVANFIDLLACGVQLHRDDHGSVLFAVPCSPAATIYRRTFFLPQNTFAKRRETILQKTKNPLGCEWVGIFSLLLCLQIRPSPP